MPMWCGAQSLRQAFENGVEEIYIGLFALAMGGVYLVAFNMPPRIEHAG